MFKHVKVEDVVTRVFCGMEQQWKVTSVTDELIVIGLGWSFDRETGVEEDEDLQWGVKYGRTGSYLKRETT